MFLSFDIPNNQLKNFNTVTESITRTEYNNLCIHYWEIYIEDYRHYKGVSNFEFERWLLPMDVARLWSGYQRMNKRNIKSLLKEN